MNFLFPIAAVAAVLSMTACERNIPVDERDKAMLLLASDLTDFGYGREDAREFDVFTKTRLFDGTGSIVYEFQTPDSETEHPLYMRVAVTFSRNVADAVVSRSAEKLAFKYSLKANDIEMREVPDFYPFGDASEFYMLEKGGTPVGNHFAVRRNSYNYSLFLSGMYFDDAEEWRKLLGEKLDRFVAYEFK